MGDMEEDQNEVKIFQRREKRREEERPLPPPPPSSFHESRANANAKIWRDSEAVEKSLGRDAGSPEYHERMKKIKEYSEKPDRQWKERDHHKEPFSRKEKEDYHAKNPQQKEKSGSQFSSRSDYSRKDRGFEARSNHLSREKSSVRDREDRIHDSSRKDRDGSRDYARDRRDYDKGRRSSELKESYPKPRNPHGLEKHLAGNSQRNNAASHDHEENPIDNLQSEGIAGGFIQGSNQRSKGSVSSLKSVGYENETSGGDGHSLLPKLKLKVGGINPNGQSDARKQHEGEDLVRPKVKKRSTPSSEPSKRRQRLILQDCSDEEDDIPDVPLKPKKHVHASEEDGFLAYLADEPSYRRAPGGGSSFSVNQNLTGVRKSTRVPKKRVFDGDDDIEVEPKKRRRKKVEVDSEEDLYHIEDDDMDQDMVDEEMIDMAGEGKAKPKRRRKSLEGDLYIGGSDSFKGGDSPEMRTTGIPLTARQRALQSSKEGVIEIGASLVEFPEGLTMAAPKKVKDSLTAAERQLKKEEAALKRKQQVEKAAKEQQASAMQKVLSQDSQRKKREGKLQKQREEMEQEKKAAEMAPATNSIRWVMGSSGTIVSFSQDLELPAIFSGPVSYPQERERCAGPSCTNTYKYRDSKTLIPLCSLQCYKAVQKPSSEATLAH